MPIKNPEDKRAFQREWMRKRRQEWIDVNGPCKECGSSSRLEVDHVDPSTKSMPPSQIWSRREEVRLKELAKCQVLCYDCHKKKSAKDVSLILTIKRPCGTHQKYAQGCRCEPCTEALRQHWRDRIASYLRQITYTFEPPLCCHPFKLTTVRSENRDLPVGVL